MDAILRAVEKTQLHQVLTPNGSDSDGSSTAADVGECEQQARGNPRRTAARPAARIGQLTNTRGVDVAPLVFACDGCPDPRT